jgi:hypothetical protein
MAANRPAETESAPDDAPLASVASEHLVPILYALERTALAMEQEDREEDARYYRELGALLSRAAGAR